MIQTVDFYTFRNSFSDSYKNHFSTEGKSALFDYLENYEEESGHQVELDPIALCVEYIEYESLEELQDNYNDIKSMEDLEERTTVIKIQGSERFIIQNF